MQRGLRGNENGMEVISIKEEGTSAICFRQTREKGFRIAIGANEPDLWQLWGLTRTTETEAKPPWVEEQMGGEKRKANRRRLVFHAA